MRIAGGQDFQKANPEVKDIMDKYYKPSVKDCKDIMDKYYEMFLVRTRQTKKTFSKVRQTRPLGPGLGRRWVN